MGRINRATGKREGGIIGLNSQQTDAVIRAARELASGDPTQMLNYLGRKRRDARFDGLVRKAMEAGKPLSQADIDKITGRYKDRLLKLRGETIARTEMLNGLRAGRHEQWQQAIEKGLDANRVRVTWGATGDARTRDTHMLLNKTKVKFGQVFTTLTGVRMAYPGDVTQPGNNAKLLAAETIQCRCYAAYSIVRGE